MRTLEVAAVIALVVEVGIMVSARFTTERRHWKHYMYRMPGTPHR